MDNYSFGGFGELTIADLMLAYRKAKVDAFYDKDHRLATKFSEYEENLLSNLTELLEKLKSTSWHDDGDLLGKVLLIPKNVKVASKENNNSSQASYHSDRLERFKSMSKYSDIGLSFRVAGDFPVNTHIISSLWVTLVGYKFDFQLSKSSYGVRLKKYEDRTRPLDCRGEYKNQLHQAGLGSFEHYSGAYRNWRKGTVSKVRDYINNGDDVFVASLDIKNFYRSLRPEFLNQSWFSSLLENSHFEYTKSDMAFTQNIISLMDNWSSHVSKELLASEALQKDDEVASINWGVPIGLTATKIIANMALHELDGIIESEIRPIHYARYVDDILLVMRDRSEIKTVDDFFNRVLAKSKQITIKQEDYNWSFSYERLTQINFTFHKDKQYLYFFSGKKAISYLDDVISEWDDMSSEYRMMPDLDSLGSLLSHKIINNNQYSSFGEHDFLGSKLDSLRRYGLALQIRQVMTLITDLPRSELGKTEEYFSQLLMSSVLNPLDIFKYIKQISQIIGVFLLSGNYNYCYSVLKRISECLCILRNTVENECRVDGVPFSVNDGLWAYIEKYYTEIISETFIKYHLPHSSKPSEELLACTRYIDLISEKLNSSVGERNLANTLDENAKKAIKSDLSVRAYKELIKQDKKYLRKKQTKEESLFKNLSGVKWIDIRSITDFLSIRNKSLFFNMDVRKGAEESLLPYLFPTRPYLDSEISELLPIHLNNGEFLNEWAKYIKVLRGVRVQYPGASEFESYDEQGNSEYPKITIGENSNDKVSIALVSIATDDKTWRHTASNKPVLSYERYNKIAKLFNQVNNLENKPDYLLFPELSIPTRWVQSLRDRAKTQGINLIVGTEYVHFNDNKISSFANLTLKDTSLGFTTYRSIWQPKLEPAPKEDENLLKFFGKSWQDKDFWLHGSIDSRSDEQRYSILKPVYVHNGFHFAVMVCSELQNTKKRADFQGLIDSLFVLSWNSDTETFASLIEGAALDLHAYIVLVNNRKYGDSRIRVPAKKRYKRDIVRLKGGDEDFVVSANINLDELRAFQSRAKRWQEDDDPFKPVPEGFKIAESRKRLPPK